VLAWMDTVGLCTPDFAAELNTTLIKPLSPGFTGVLVQSGLVHPQDACTLDITKGAWPTLVNSNSCSTTLPSAMVPKSYSMFSNSNCATVLGSTAATFCAFEGTEPGPCSIWAIFCSRASIRSSLSLD